MHLEDLTEKARHFLLNGASGRFLGMLRSAAARAKRYKQYIRVFCAVQLAKVCLLRGAAQARSSGGPRRRRTIAHVAALSVGELRDWIAALELTPFQRAVAVHILAELASASRRERVGWLPHSDA